MSLRFAGSFLLALSAAAAVLPELRIEATTGGSVFHVRNVSSQPLTAFLIELVDYPGSSYSFWQDDVTKDPIAPGGERRIPVSSMTVGAVPDYVKLQAALYADGTSAGLPEKVTQLVERRRFVLETTRELIRRLEKGLSAGDLRQWAASMQPPGRARPSQTTINQAAARGLIGETVSRIEARSADEALKHLRSEERALASSKPAL